MTSMKPLAAAFPISTACGCSNSCSPNELTPAWWLQSTGAPGSCGTWGCKCSRCGQGTQAGCKRHDLYGRVFFCQIVLAGAVTSRDDSVMMQKHAKTTRSMGFCWVHVEFALTNGDCDLSWRRILLLRARVLRCLWKSFTALYK